MILPWHCAHQHRRQKAIKIARGCALMRLVGSNEQVDVSAVGDRPGSKVSARMLTEVIQARYEELFGLIHAELRNSGYGDLIAAGMVLTGGASLIPGAVDLAEFVFRMPIRIGIPQRVTGLEEVATNPSYATSIGLLLYAQQQDVMTEALPRDGMKGVLGRVKQWLQGNF